MANREFNKLSIDEQVTFINNQLEKDKNLSLRKLCEKFGLSRTTLQSRFKNNGYEYDPYDRKYKNNTKVLENYKSNELIFLHEIEKKKNDLLELLELKEDIKRLIQEQKERKTIVEVIETQFTVSDEIKGTPVNRSVKLYDKANKELQELYSMYSEMKKCDVLSEIIHEAYLKYKKIK